MSTAGTKLVTIPGAFLDDWQSARESWESDVEAGGLPPTEVALIESVFHKIDTGRPSRADGVVVELTADEAIWLLEEARYRWEYNGGGGNVYGCEDPSPKARQASDRLMKRLAGFYPPIAGF